MLSITFPGMLTLSSLIKTTGTLPRSFVLEEILNRESLTSIAEQVYDTKPNIVALVGKTNKIYVVKLFGWRNPVHYYLSRTFPSRAQVSWDIAQLLIEGGAKTPKPVFVYTERKFGFIKNNLFITEAIHPHQTYRSLLKSGNSNEQIKNATTDLAKSIARMHNSGIFHRDLTTGNFLVSSTGEVFIVDLNRAQQIKKLSLHQRLTDVAKIYFKTKNDNLNSEIMNLFFGIYEEESKFYYDWISGYKDYRKRLVTRRQIKRRLKSSLRRKQTDTVGM